MTHEDKDSHPLLGHRQCGMCGRLYAESVELPGQPVRCTHCLGVALELAQRERDALRVRVVELEADLAERRTTVETLWAATAPPCKCDTSEPCKTYPCDCACHVNEVQP